jgi:glycopeptide antibiotics resistance protein
MLVVSDMVDFIFFICWLILGCVGGLLFLGVNNTQYIEDMESVTVALILGGIGGVVTLVVALIFRSRLFKPKDKQ